MKKILLILVLTLVTGLSIQASEPSKNVSKEAIKEAIEKKISGMKLDSLSTVQVKDSVVQSILNDTILKNKTADDKDYTFTFYTDSDNPHTETIITALAIVTPFLAIVAIVIASLIVSYNKRKRRYQMIEKAIDKNYQIPEYLLSESGSAQGQMPKGKADGTSSYLPMRWDGVRSGSIISAVGLGGLFAFGFGFMGGVFSILIFIGIAKIVINVLEQKSYREYANKYDTWNTTLNKDNSKTESGTVPPPFPNEENKD